MPALFLFLLFIPLFASAQTPPLVPACDVGTYTCQLADIITLVDNVLRFIITLSVIVAVLLIVYAGFLLLTDRGNQQNRTTAVKTLWAALIGLVIVLAAWLIVNTVLTILTGKSLNDWSAIERATVRDPGGVDWDGAGGPGGGGPGGGDGGVSVGVGGINAGTSGCPGCVPINDAGTFRCVANAPGETIEQDCNIDAAYLAQLERLSDWSSRMIITEGYAPTGHQNPCHRGGTCVDIVFTNSNAWTADQIRTFQADAAAAGFRAVYEPPQGVGCGSITACQPWEVTRSSGHHFSLYQTQ